MTGATEWVLGTVEMRIDLPERGNKISRSGAHSSSPVLSLAFFSVELVSSSNLPFQIVGKARLDLLNRSSLRLLFLLEGGSGETFYRKKELSQLAQIFNSRNSCD